MLLKVLLSPLGNHFSDFAPKKSNTSQSSSFKGETFQITSKKPEHTACKVEKVQPDQLHTPLETDITDMSCITEAYWTDSYLVFILKGVYAANINIDDAHRTFKVNT